MFIKKHNQRLQNQANEGGESGGGDAIAPEVQAKIDAAVAAATIGLKNKNTELLGSLKAEKEALKAYEGIDPVATRNMMKQFTDGEEAALLAVGKIDEVLSKRTERLKTDYEKQLNASKSTIDQLNAKAAKLAAGKVSGALTAAASKAGALSEGMEDIVLRGQSMGWTVNDDGDVVAVREGQVVLGKDGNTPLTPIEWAESLRETAPHLWPKAQGSGAQGSGTGGTPTANKGNLGGTKEQRTAAIAARFPNLKTA